MLLFNFQINCAVKNKEQVLREEKQNKSSFQSTKISSFFFRIASLLETFALIFKMFFG